MDSSHSQWRHYVVPWPSAPRTVARICIIDLVPCSLTVVSTVEALREYEIAQSLGINTPRSRYNQGISLMSLGRYAEAQESFVQALHLQVPVNNTSTVRPDLRDSYRCIWVTLGLLCELQGDSEGRIQADIGNLNAFLR